jgi:hypothetical protein
VILLALLLGLGAASGAGEAPAPGPGKVDRAQIAKLIGDLGARDWAVREAASKKLAAIGEPAVELLRKACGHKDPEVAQRAKALIAAITKAGALGYRSGGGRKRAVARFGGSPATESAVEAGLRWLARHQARDGSWGYLDDRKRIANAGLTGASLLAFQGAGYTTKAGKFRDNVRRAVRWIVSKQDGDGRIGKGADSPFTAGDGWAHAVCGTALAEAYAMTRDPQIGGPAQKATDASRKLFFTKFSGFSFQAGGKPSTNATTAFLIQMKTAKVAGLKVPAEVFQGAMGYLTKVTDKTGRCAARPGAKGPDVSATAGGMVCRVFMGVPRSDKTVQAGGNYLAANLPETAKGRVRDPNGLLLGTLASFQHGGQVWKKWNTALKKELLENQRRGGPMDGSANDVDGSWDPIGEACAGRVYATAVLTLCLETYYRYLPAGTK